MKTTAKLEIVKQAIEAVNKEHGYKIILKDSKQLTKNILNFTIRSEKSGIPGSCYSYRGRKSVSASWHAHGYVIDEIFRLSPDCYVESLGKRYFVDTWRWHDRQLNNILNPIYTSELSIH
jgi:hypothetical protein